MRHGNRLGKIWVSLKTMGKTDDLFYMGVVILSGNVALDILDLRWYVPVIRMVSGETEMICFRDMTFCDAYCMNKKCPRQYTLEVDEAARKWWDHDPDNAPVAFSDFSGNCKDYIEPNNCN